MCASNGLRFYPNPLGGKIMRVSWTVTQVNTKYASRIENPWVVYSVIQWRTICIVAMEESVRFELTEHYCSSVFKTDAINQTLPTFHVALGARLELATLWLTARCSTIELPKNKCNPIMCGRFE